MILITILAPAFSQVSRNFGPPEYFLLACMGLLTLIVMIGSKLEAGPRVGADRPRARHSRRRSRDGSGALKKKNTFGSAELIGGIYFIPIAIGLFGLGELFYAFYSGLHRSGTGGLVQYDKESRFWPTVEDYISTRWTMVRGSVLGFVVGVIPGAGANHRLAHGLFDRALAVEDAREIRQGRDGRPRRARDGKQRGPRPAR